MSGEEIIALLTATEKTKEKESIAKTIEESIVPKLAEGLEIFQRPLREGRRTRYILSCDGGGVRGRASARFLEQLEHELQRRLHDVFDMFVGTSVGSFIAAGLASGNYSASEVYALFNKENTRRLFKQTWCEWMQSCLRYRPLLRPKYGGREKSAFLQEHFGKIQMCDVPKPLLITTNRLVNRQCMVSECYKSTNTDGRCTYSVADLCDASSAAQTYFPGVMLDGSLHIDGGNYANNPVVLAALEAAQLWPDDDYVILSLGTGENTVDFGALDNVRNYGILQWAPRLLPVLMDGGRFERLAKEWTESREGLRYVRVNSSLSDGVSPDLDCVSDSNFTALERMGDRWFKHFCEQGKL